MIEFVTEFQGILTAIGVTVSGVTGYFAGRKQRRINNLDKQLDVFGKMIDKFDELVKRQNQNDRAGHTTDKKL